MNNEFQTLAQQVIQWTWNQKPVAATYHGYHAHDDRFAIFNVEYLKDVVTQSEELSTQLRRFRDNTLDRVELAQRDMLRQHLELVGADVVPMDYHSRAADLYVMEITSGLYPLLFDESRPLAERLEPALGRLRGIWRVLREGMANLRAGRNVPKLWTENAIQITENLLRLYDTVLPEFIAHVESSEMREDLRDALSTSRQAIEHYLNFLRLDMLASSKGKCAVGKDHFNQILRQRHHFKVVLGELAQQVEDEVTKARETLNECARDIHPTLSWRDILEELRENPVPQEEVLIRYEEEAARALAFVEQHKLVTVPRHDLRMSWMPGHLRHLFPYVCLIAPAPDRPSAYAYFFANQVEGNRHEDIRTQQQQAHFKAHMPLTVVQWLYPGMLVGSLHRQQLSDPIQRFFDAGFLREGWSAYGVDLMESHGYFNDPFERLMLARYRLLNAVRAHVDIRYHTQEMTFEESVDTLVNECGFEPFNAEREVRRYAATPTRPISHLLGARQLRELRELRMQAEGPAFDLCRFHDAVLNCGYVPMDVVQSLIDAGHQFATRDAAASPASTAHDAPPAAEVKPEVIEASPASPPPHRAAGDTEEAAVGRKSPAKTGAKPRKSAEAPAVNQGAKPPLEPAEPAPAPAPPAPAHAAKKPAAAAPEAPAKKPKPAAEARPRPSASPATAKSKASSKPAAAKAPAEKPAKPAARPAKPVKTR